MVELAVDKGEFLDLTLEGPAGGWSFDRIGLDYGSPVPLTSRWLSATGAAAPDPDGTLTLFYGDHVDLSFAASPVDGSETVTPVLEMRGYYVRWPRRHLASGEASAGNVPATRAVP